MTAYNAALAALNVREIGKTRSAHGTVGAAIAYYYKDNRFTSLAPGTQKNVERSWRASGQSMVIRDLRGFRSSTSPPF